MSRPLFSCVIPVKGDRPFFKDALASLEAQGMGEGLEVIIQEGTTEGTECTEETERTEIPKGLNVQWFRERDVGQSDALNKGFAKAKGEWLFWLNVDDVLLPGALMKVKQLLHSSTPPLTTLNWIAGNQLLVDDAGKVLKCSVGNGWHNWLYRNAVPHVYGPSAFFRRELFEKVGGFDANLKYCMDWELWIRFMQAGAKFVRINDYLWAQRQWSGSKTQRQLTKAEWDEQQGEIRRMLAKNGLVVTKWGTFKTRLWRMMNGNYLQEAVDTFRMRGRCVS